MLYDLFTLVASVITVQQILLKRKLLQKVFDLSFLSAFLIITFVFIDMTDSPPPVVSGFMSIFDGIQCNKHRGSE